MKSSRSIPWRFELACFFVMAVFAIAQNAKAQQTWQLKVGAESPDMGKQALAFLPDEIWIHAGDSITWTWQSDEIHTLTFLTVGQPLPAFTAGCPGFATSPAVFDGSTCMTTPPMVKPQTFTVMFPTAGSFKFECLVHLVMTGTVHVLSLSEKLPHDQAFYDKQATAERQTILSDIGEKKMSMSHDGDKDGDDGFTVTVIPGKKHVTAGIGETSSTPGGIQTGSLVRFVNDTVTIHAGDTVEWGNFDPLEPHTITFGPDPGDLFDPSSNVSIDSDGALHVTLNSPSDTAHSGFIEQPLEDEPGIPQNPIVNAQNPLTNITNVALDNPTRFRVTFTSAGTYNYHCSLHDNLGMVGKVIVVP
ncbi:MAG TPA: plastocyanin/azurin family copper-binding protein [Candidatus Acidoferrales bacterium]|nr:plastocyanin/azurin family copper-binding protein [Candidatus Acidoferrales bacterium]